MNDGGGRAMVCMPGHPRTGIATNGEFATTRTQTVHTVLTSNYDVAVVNCDVFNVRESVSEKKIFFI